MSELRPQTVNFDMVANHLGISLCEIQSALKLMSASEYWKQSEEYVALTNMYNKLGYQWRYFSGEVFGMPVD